MDRDPSDIWLLCAVAILSVLGGGAHDQEMR